MKRAFISAALMAIGITGCGEPARKKAQAAAGISIASSWCRASPQAAKAASCFLTVSNGGPADDKIIGAVSSSSRDVQVNETYADGNVLRMRPVKSLTVPAHKEVALAPGGYVLRLVDLKAPLVVGSTVPVTLKFQAAGDKQILFPVRIEAESEG